VFRTSCAANSNLCRFEANLGRLRFIQLGSILAPIRGQNQAVFQSYVLQNQQIASGDYSPEKAGVGGSTPSLATIILKNLVAKSGNFQPTIQPMILTELAR
jgi:hypothetical protein